MSQSNRIQNDFGYALRNLRHLYEQMKKGQVKNTVDAANGLLGPGIESVEKLQAIAIHLEAVCTAACVAYADIRKIRINVGDVADAETVQLFNMYQEAIGRPIRDFEQFIREM